MPGLYFEVRTIRRKWLPIVVCASAFLTWPTAESFACSCPELSVQETLQQTTVVFMGRVQKKERQSQKYNGKIVSGHHVEDVVFKVIKIWKGAKPGQTVRMHSEIGPGACGMSVYNDPPVVIELDPRTRKGKPMAISDEWLVYGFGKEPYELSMCLRSWPINFRPAKHDMDVLDSLVTRKSSH